LGEDEERSEGYCETGRNLFSAEYIAGFQGVCFRSDDNIVFYHPVCICHAIVQLIRNHHPACRSGGQDIEHRSRRGAYAARKSANKGWLKGAATGICYVVLVSLIGVISGAQFAFDRILLSDTLMAIVVGAAGGAIGINIR
jgi:hypothetical protein